MKNKIGTILIAFALGMVLMFFLRGNNVKEVKVPFKVEIPVEVVKNVFDTIYYPIPVVKTKIEVDSSLVDEYKKANDSLKKELFEKAVTVNDYVETFEDSIQTITVKAQTTGTLNSLQASYETKPRTVTLDTTLTVEVPHYKRSLTPYSEVGIPTKLSPNLEQAMKNTVVLKVGIDFKTKKNWTYGLSYDTEKRVWVKIGKTFNF